MNKDRFVEAMLKGIFGADGESPIRNSIFAKKVLLLYLQEPQNLKMKFYNIDLREPKQEDSELLNELYGKLQTAEPQHDCRITKVMMHGIRGVGKTDDQVYYGLDCTDNTGSPCSMVLVGANGIGKTSFYSALEIIGMGQSNCARLRGYTSRDLQIKFMKNANGASADGHILIKLADEKVISLKLNDYANGTFTDNFIGESCFCSDFDLQTLENYSYNSTKNNFTEYIHSQLGLSGFDMVYSILERYHDEMVGRATEIRTNTEEILKFKIMLFQLLAERAIIDRRNQRESFSVDMISCYLGSQAQAIAELEGKIINNDEASFTPAEIETLLHHYQNAIDLLYGLAYIPKDKCREEFSAIEESIINGSFFFQTAEDLKGSDLSYLHHECMAILKAVLDRKQPPEILKARKESFSQIHVFHNLIKDTIERLLMKQPLTERREAIEDEIREIREELTKQRIKLTGSLAISMADYSDLIEKSQGLKTFLEQRIVRYDQQIFEILKNSVPAICEKSFSSGNGEEVEINYGDTTQTAFTRPKKFKLAIKVRLTNKDENGNPMFEIEEPCRYLNTFRYKLFCFSLKLALSCCAMKLDNCWYPIMVDDVFDASDFINRNEISHVIKELAEQYTRLSDNPIPLQLILFSQDEIVAERVYKGLTEAGNHAKLECLIPPVSYKDADKFLLKQNLSKSKNLLFNLYNWFAISTWSTFSLPTNKTESLIEFNRVSDNITQNFPHDNK